MITKTIETFTATIHVGLKNRDSGEILDKQIAIDFLQNYCDKVGFCVSVTDTYFVYTNGNEPGLIIGLINYPRFPSTPSKIKINAYVIATELLSICQQYKISIVFPDETIMVSSTEEL